jgi:GNAT superfamily N-acetyltransferase
MMPHGNHQWSPSAIKAAVAGAHDLSLRVLGRDELSTVLNWAAQEGWNPGQRDGECFHAADPEAFLLGERRGEPISSISVVCYPENFAFLGCYMVRPEFRGQGYGLKTWRAGMRRLAGYNVGLDGVVAQQRNYVKSGFTLAWRNIRYAGQVAPVASPAMRTGDIVPLSSVPFPAVCSYDRRHFPAARPTFLSLWMSRPGTTALGLLRDRRLSGYGVIRPCQTGFKIGPLFADDDKAADALFLALAAKAGSGQVFIDPPEPNLAAVRLAERYGLKPAFETARMYTGPVPEIGLRGIFGITSFELG